MMAMTVYSRPMAVCTGYIMLISTPAILAMTAPKPKHIAKDLARAFENQPLYKNLTEIGLTGGEPFLRDDLAEIGLFFLNHFPNAQLSINTNGLLSDKIIKVMELLIKALSKDGRNRIRISFSIDGIETTHDSIRGVPNNFQKTMETIKQMKRNILGIEYGLTFTVLPENYDQIMDAYTLSKELNVGFSFSIAQTSGTFYQNTDTPFCYTPEMLKTINDQIHEIQQDSNHFTNYYYSKMVEYKRNPGQYVKCYAGYNSFFLDPYGFLYPCILYNRSFGNIKDFNFQEMTNSDLAKDVRNSIRDTHCHCWGCESEVSFRRSWKVVFWRALHFLSKSSKFLQ